ncbi:MAG TPA: zinc-ribbon and DUF3426 domain-containing protein [Steroidobacteraceae bacterium]|nr:zinc-ribbon and DUF3426 domain-containing protein [Steroidobacteraceae bacterium]
MFTVCSKCSLRLTVTATDLRAAQGYVRCGRCHNVFNALATLADEPAATGTPVAVVPRPPEPEPEPLPPPPAPATDDGEADAALEFNPASTNINEVFIEPATDERTGTFESIILVSDESAAGSLDFELAPEPPPLDDPTRPHAPAQVEETATDAATDGGREIPAALEADQYIDPGIEPEPAVELPEVEPTPGRVTPWPRYAAAVVLVLALVAQVVHHYRNELVDIAALRRPLTAVYEGLGLPLEPRWDVAKYDIRQLGAATDGGAANALVVRASISNRAARDQPLPLLRVVMQDRFGNRVAARDLNPAEYLGRGAPQVSLMAPGQRVDVQVAFQDPGQAATGFEIDACMAGHDHIVTCANDPVSH